MKPGTPTPGPAPDNNAGMSASGRQAQPRLDSATSGERLAAARRIAGALGHKRANTTRPYYPQLLGSAGTAV